jgi:hypothetical protein
MLGKPTGILWKFLIPSGVVRRHRTPAGQAAGIAHLSQADGGTLRGPPQILWEPSHRFYHPFRSPLGRKMLTESDLHKGFPVERGKLIAANAELFAKIERIHGAP